ncbi:MAG: hypothetical protein HYW51_00260 [Candidatus Doudnabacteria bacterium]|nr:hypothetical protein [Candidatus Doudnabacteria bacterium]
MLFDPNFWFVQPALTLAKADLVLGYVFAVLLGLAILARIAKIFTRHKVVSKLLNKLFYLNLVIGILGLFWFGLRFESTPIFSTRFWVGLVILGGIIWLGFFFKYLIFNFFTERREFDALLLKNKYIPGKKK